MISMNCLVPNNFVCSGHCIGQLLEIPHVVDMDISDPSGCDTIFSTVPPQIVEVDTPNQSFQDTPDISGHSHSLDSEEESGSSDLNTNDGSESSLNGNSANSILKDIRASKT